MIEIVVAPLLLAGGLVVLGVRNEFTHTYRMRMIDAISRRNKEEIKASKPGDLSSLQDVHRWSIYAGVSRNKMLFKFWKPLDSFYPKEFLEDLKK